MSRENNDGKNDAPEDAKKPPISGTVAGRVPVPAVSGNDDPASPGADADRRKAED